MELSIGQYRLDWRSENTLAVYQGLDPASDHSLDISGRQGDWPSFFSHVLDNRAARMPLLLSDAEADRVRFLFFDSRNRLQFQGYRTLQLAFPFLFLPGPSEPRLAPLLLGEVDLTYPVPGSDVWGLSFDPLVHRLRPNAVLLESLPPEAPWAELRDLLLRASGRLFGQLDDWSEQAGFGKMEPDEEQLPDPYHLAEARDMPFLLPGGRLTLLLPQVFARQEPPAESLPAAQTVPGQGHPLTHLDLDPHQAAAFRMIRTNSLCAVTGEAGSGKKQLLRALLINALANRQKVLVLSDRLPTLYQMQRELEQTGVARLGFLLRSLETDKALLLEMLKTEAQLERQPLGFDYHGWQRLLQQHLESHARLDQAYHAVTAPVFGDHSFGETVGLFLQNEQKGDKSLLNPLLSASQFDFSFAVYEQLNEKVQAARRLYEPVQTLRHPLRQLNRSLFLSLDPEEAAEFAGRQLDDQIRRASDLQRDLVGMLDQYGESLRLALDRDGRELADKVNQIRAQLNRNRKLYGKDFLLASDTSVGLYRLVSGKVREIHEARRNLRRQFADLIAAFSRQGHFDFSFPEAPGQIPVRSLEEWLDRFAGALEEWKTQLPALVQQETVRLSSVHVHPLMQPMEGRIQEMETRMDAALEALNQNKLLDEPVRHQMLTLAKRQQFVDELLDRLENIRLNFSDFEPFYAWYNFWLGLDASEKALLSALVKVKPDDWTATFRAWFLHQALRSAESIHLPERSLQLQEHALREKALREKLPAYVQALWSDWAGERLQQLRKRDKGSYQNLFGRRNQELCRDKTIRQVMEEGIESILDVIPAFFCTSFSATEAFAGVDSPVFDLLLVEGGQYVDPALGIPLLRLARRTAVIGDDRFAVSDGRPDLLESVLSVGPPRAGLLSIHQYYSGHLWQLLRPGRIAGHALPAPEARVYPVYGVFLAREGQNEAEARKVIDLLNDIKKTPQRTFPKVGIVTGTPGQRDLLAGLLLQIKRADDPAAELIRQLERNGLAILHLGELQGHRFDQVIFSLTFGLDPETDRVSRYIARLNTAAGKRQLHELMATGGRSVWVVHSLSPELMTAVMNGEPGDGNFALVSYLQFLEALQRNDHARQTTLLERFAARLGAEPEPADLRRKVFYDEVAGRLQPFLGSDRVIRNFRLAHLSFPLVITSDHLPNGGYLLCQDGFLHQSETTDYVWEAEQRHFLREHQLEELPVWSVLWWRDPEGAARKLAGKIMHFDQKG